MTATSADRLGVALELHRHGLPDWGEACHEADYIVDTIEAAADAARRIERLLCLVIAAPEPMCVDCGEHPARHGGLCGLCARDKWGWE